MESIGVATDLIKSLIKVILVLIFTNVATVGGFLVYLSLPVEERSTEVLQYEDDYGSVSYIGGDYNGVPIYQEDNQEKKSEEK